MADAMNAAVSGNSSKKTWGALHMLGSAASSIVLGIALGGIGRAIGAAWQPATIVAVLVLALIYMARALWHLPIPLPEARRQVPAWWQSFFSPPTVALLYGAGLGIGFATYLGYGTLAVVAVAALASGSPLAGAILFGAFGLSRAAAVVWATGSSGPALERIGSGKAIPVLNAAVLGSVAAAGALSVSLLAH